MIKFESVKAMTMAVSNANEEGRTYGISAEVSVNQNDVTNIREGKVTSLLEDKEIATFSKHEYRGGLSSNIHGAADSEEEMAIFVAIQAFIKELDSAAAEKAKAITL